VEARASGNDMASPRPRDAGSCWLPTAASTSAEHVGIACS
jgi:hypothetical protein